MSIKSIVKPNTLKNKQKVIVATIDFALICACLASDSKYLFFWEAGVCVKSSKTEVEC